MSRIEHEFNHPTEETVVNNDSIRSNIELSGEELKPYVDASYQMLIKLLETPAPFEDSVGREERIADLDSVRIEYQLWKNSSNTEQIDE